MSKSIDERIVDMQFNNRQFESGVKESLGSLDRLKKGLNLDGASKSLTGLGEAGKRFSLAGIAEGVDTIAGKFTTLGIIGVTALQNIVNSAVNFGKRIVSALTIDPIITGFSEYELKMGAIQTIMAGTGATLDEVNKKLNELNTYSDKTIYSFSDMTKNIGKFTNAGVSLNKSVGAIQGISNAAALSGANADEASRAMYNFAQAISSGFVKLIDWKSIELANMATVEFKNQLIAGAVAAGTLKDAGNGLYQTYKGTLISATQGFNDSLQDQWMTSNVLIDVLGKYSDETTDIGKRAFAAAQDIKTLTQMYDTLKEAAQSGWAQSWEIIAGDFEEGKTLYTQLGAAIGGMIQRSADARNAMLQFWKDNGGRTALIESFKNAFGALNQVLTPIREAFQQLFPPLTGERLVEMTNALKAFTEKLKVGEETINNIRRTFAGFFAILSIGKQAISAIVGGIVRLFKILAPGAGSFLGFTAGVGDWLVSLDAAIKKGDIFNKAIQKIADVIEWVADKVGKGISAIIDFFTGFGSVDLSGVESFTEKIRIRFEPFSALFEGIGKIFSNTVEILKKVAPLFYKLASMIGKGIMSLQERILGALDKGSFSSILDIINTGLFGTLILGIRKFVNSMSKVTGGFSGILNGVKGSLEAWQSSLKAGILLKIAIAIGILAVSLALLASIDSNKLTGALAAITTLFIELFGAMAIFSKIMAGSGLKGMTGVSIAMIGVSIAVLILSSALAKLAGLSWDEIEKGLIAVGALMGMLVLTAKLLSANTGSMIKGATGFILFAVAINILASAVKKLGEIDIVSLGKGLLAVGILMTELALFMKATDINKMGITKGLGILLLATAMTVLASAVKKLSEIDLGALTKGLSAMGVILLELGLFINATPDAKRVISTAIGLVILGAAMLIFASAIEKMGSLSLEQIGKGLLTMAGALTAIVIALQFMPKNMIIIGIGMIGIATALLILANALDTMGGMTWGEIAKGLVVLAGSLTIIAIAMLFMRTALPGAAALLVVSVALTILSKVLQTLGSMSLAEIGKVLLAMAGIFVILGVAGLVLGPLVPVLLGLAAAVALLGVGLLAIGAGLLLFSMGLTALAVAGAAGTAALVAIVTALIGLIPFLLEQIGYAIIAFAGVIIEGMPVILEAIGALFAGIIKLLGELTPPLILTVLNFILELLTKLVEYVPKFVDAGMKIIIGFLQGIAKNITGVVKAGIDIILNFLEGIRQKIPAVIDMAFKLIIAFINGLANAIRNNHEAIYNAVENLITAIIEAITSFLGRLPKIGGQIVSGLITGILNMGKSLVDAAKGVISNAIDGAKKLLGINSPSKVFTEIGENTGKGMIIGLNGMSGKVAAASEDLGKTAANSMSDALGHVQDVDLQPTIRPVVDMTDVESGLKSTFDKQQGLNVTTSADKVSTVAAQRQNGSDSSGINQTTTNTDDSRVVIHNHYTVRNDNDIRKISRDQRNLLDRYNLAKGVPVTP